MVGDRTRGAAVGAIVGGAWMAGLFAAAPLAGGFAVNRLAEAVIVASPGWFATAAIELLGELAQPTLVASVALAVLALAAALGAVWSRLPGTAAERTAAGATAGTALTAALLRFVGAEWSLALVASVALAVAPPALAAFLLAGAPAETGTRRPFLRRAGLVLVGGLAGVAVARRATESVGDRETRAGAPLSGADAAEEKRTTGRTVAATATRTPAGADDEAFGYDFGGMPAAVTAPEDHYVVDINVEDPAVDADEWSLDVTGAVESPYSLSYDELLAHDERVEQTVTMLCISNEIGGDLISTGRWRGVPLPTLLDAAGVADEAVDVVTHAVDGYSEAIPVDVARRTDVLLAYGLGDAALTERHGFPARLLIPGRYGMKSTKWVTEIELATAEHDAYWEARGWDEEAVVNTLSYVRAAERRGERVAVGGVAYAGRRGVERVEVSVDGGDTWNDAALEAPVSEHAWRRWRHVFEDPDGDAVAAVTRATDGEGTTQTSERTNPHPAGATGWHSTEIPL